MIHAVMYITSSLFCFPNNLTTIDFSVFIASNNQLQRKVYLDTNHENRNYFMARYSPRGNSRHYVDAEASPFVCVCVCMCVSQTLEIAILFLLLLLKTRRPNPFNGLSLAFKVAVTRSVHPPNKKCTYLYFMSSSLRSRHRKCRRAG